EQEQQHADRLQPPAAGHAAAGRARPLLRGDTRGGIELGLWRSGHRRVGSRAHYPRARSGMVAGCRRPPPGGATDMRWRCAPIMIARIATITRIAMIATTAMTAITADLVAATTAAAVAPPGQVAVPPAHQPVMGSPAGGAAGAA